MNELKVPQLKSFAKYLKLTGYNKLSKNDLVELIRKQFKGISKQKKHKKKYLRKEERKKDKKVFRRIEAEKREKIKAEKEQKKEQKAEDKREKRRGKNRKQKQKQKKKKQKEQIQVKEFREKAEQKKKSLKRLQEKDLVETESALKKFARQFTVEGEPGFDPKSFFNITKRSLLRILRENRQQKVKLILKCFDEEN